MPTYHVAIVVSVFCSIDYFNHNNWTATITKKGTEISLTLPVQQMRTWWLRRGAAGRGRRLVWRSPRYTCLSASSCHATDATVAWAQIGAATARNLSLHKLDSRDQRGCLLYKIYIFKSIQAPKKVSTDKHVLDWRIEFWLLADFSFYRLSLSAERWRHQSGRKFSGWCQCHLLVDSGINNRKITLYSGHVGLTTIGWN